MARRRQRARGSPSAETTRAAERRRQTTSAAIVAKDGDLVLLCDADGQIPLGGDHALGLYYHDCRFVDGYQLRIGRGVKPDALLASADDGFHSVFQLTNPDLVLEGGATVPKQRIGIRWTRTIDAGHLAVHDVIAVTNFDPERVDVPVSLAFDSRFEDIFEVRGMPGERRGTVRAPEWNGPALTLAYDGADDVRRSVVIHFSSSPERTETSTAHFAMSLDPGQTTVLVATLVVSETPEDARGAGAAARPDDVERVHASLSRSADEWMQQQPDVTSDSRLLNRVLQRSLRDLRVLRSALRDEHFFAAGVPWYVTLFGRDSITAALQTLAFAPEVAASTLRLLASYQGTRRDEWRDEEPGKIAHELRVGEMARLGEIPQTPYYGSIDATPLFLVLLARHAAWTGDLSLFTALRDNVDRALDWIATSGDATRAGYLAYARRSAKGLANQGWKDSGDAIMNADGTLAAPPIALVEVQGYVYLAKMLIADLYRRAGDSARAQALVDEAAQLRERFDHDFWLEDLDTYALALQRGGVPAAVIASNPGQALWSGIAEPAKAHRVIRTLMREDMWSGWGVRTLSAQARRYNPIGYHLGTVWPHDNSLIAAGCRRYGGDEAALRICTGIVDAAAQFPHARLPEVFAGFPRGAFPAPVRYPVACHPQAWAAGSVPYLIETLLGLAPNAFDRVLRIEHPILPDFVRHVRLAGLRVGDARADLEFERRGDGTAAVHVRQVQGHLDILVEPGEAPHRIAA